MNLLTRGCFGGNLSGVLCVPKIITFSILGLFFVLTSVSDGSPGPGRIAGDVTVFQKKLFGKLKKKKDMSGVFVISQVLKVKHLTQSLILCRKTGNFIPTSCR